VTNTERRDGVRLWDVELGSFSGSLMVGRLSFLGGGLGRDVGRVGLGVRTVRNQGGFMTGYFGDGDR
jgi:hypothetical protein